mmetsp:Transcript_114887/g.336070  ORF Transcript_114887/g.336070 Transcript_114887/m.336070 type:complete len:209 (-) Transcript_114887:171-797(-)
MQLRKQLQGLGCLSSVQGRGLPIPIGTLQQEQHPPSAQCCLLARRSLMAQRVVLHARLGQLVGQAIRGVAHDDSLVDEEGSERWKPAPRKDRRKLLVEARLVPVGRQVPTQGTQGLGRQTLGNDLLQIDCPVVSAVTDCGTRCKPQLGRVRLGPAQLRPRHHLHIKNGMVISELSGAPKCSRQAAEGQRRPVKACHDVASRSTEVKVA